MAGLQDILGAGFTGNPGFQSPGLEPGGNPTDVSSFERGIALLLEQMGATPAGAGIATSPDYDEEQKYLKLINILKQLGIDREPDRGKLGALGALDTTLSQPTPPIVTNDPQVEANPGLLQLMELRNQLMEELRGY